MLMKLCFAVAFASLHSFGPTYFTGAASISGPTAGKPESAGQGLSTTPGSVSLSRTSAFSVVADKSRYKVEPTPKMLLQASNAVRRLEKMLHHIQLLTGKLVNDTNVMNKRWHDLYLVEFNEHKISSFDWNQTEAVTFKVNHFMLWCFETTQIMCFYANKIRTNERNQTVCSNVETNQSCRQFKMQYDDLLTRIIGGENCSYSAAPQRQGGGLRKGADTLAKWYLLRFPQLGLEATVNRLMKIGRRDPDVTPDCLPSSERLRCYANQLKRALRLYDGIGTVLNVIKQRRRYCV